MLQGAQKREQRFKTIESIMLKFTKVQQGTMLARDLFFSFDVDNSKTINIHEFCESISKLQATEQTGTESTSEQKLPMGLMRDIFQVPTPQMDDVCFGYTDLCEWMYILVSFFLSFFLSFNSLVLSFSDFK